MDVAGMEVDEGRQESQHMNAALPAKAHIDEEAQAPFLLLQQIREQPAASPPAEPLPAAGLTLEDFTPCPQNLEWKLGTLMWQQQGIEPFVRGDVPFVINASGPGSVYAAQVLLAHCLENPPEEEFIALLEVGAGSGLFARYLLDTFQDLCQQQGHDFYERLVFHITDGSPATVKHWQHIGLFAPHARQVRLQVCDARRPQDATRAPLRAVYANYLLDSMPTRFVRRTEAGWELLHARAWLRGDTDLKAYTPLSPGHIREAARNDFRQLLPLLPALESELRFQPLPSTYELPNLPLLDAIADAISGKAFPDCHGALEAMQNMTDLLMPAGYISVRDYGSASAESHTGSAGDTRFGEAVAHGLCFPLLKTWAASAGLHTVDTTEPDSPMQIRLFTRRPLPQTARAFQQRPATQERVYLETLEQARAQAAAGRVTLARKTLRDCVASSPENWHLVAEVGRILLEDLHDAAAALEPLLSSLHRNPWYNPEIWTVAGDCLQALDRHEDARSCYQRAGAVYPGDPVASARLARCDLHNHQPEHALLSAARGLVGDRKSQHRQDLLRIQQQALETLSTRRTRERETALRREQQICC
jgi:tetratricopeptide (TPR) repeat protein